MQNQSERIVREFITIVLWKSSRETAYFNRKKKRKEMKANKN